MQSNIFPLPESVIETMLRRTKQDIIPEDALFAIGIEECGEPLVTITDKVEVTIRIAERRKLFSDETLYARKGVITGLELSTRQLQTQQLGYKLCIYDAFRPIEYQQRRFEQEYADVQKNNPDWTPEQVRAETFIRVFPPSWDLRTPPAHSTGGALDLTIIDTDGNELDMGNKYASADKRPEYTARMYTNAEDISSDQRTNRVLLVRAMAAGGFVNFPGEWWHYSVGDREWAAYLGKSTAYYTRAENPYADRMAALFDTQKAGGL